MILTTNPTLIKEANCSPGLSDHDLVSAEALLKPILHKQKPHKTILLFSKADWPRLKAKMKQYQTSFGTIEPRQANLCLRAFRHDKF